MFKHKAKKTSISEITLQFQSTQIDLSNESEDYESCYATLLFTLMYYLSCRKEYIFYLKIVQVELSFSHPRSVSNG